MNNKGLSLIAILISIVLIVGGIFYARTTIENSNIKKVTDEADSTAPPISTGNENETSTYQNDDFGITFEYPSHWEGPAVFQEDNRFIAEIGTDNVYSYDTMADDRHYSIPNSYYIRVNITKKPTDQTVAEYSKNNVSWIDPYLTNMALKVGDSTNTTRIATTKIRDVNKGNFKGAEFLVTLSPQAQTEHVYQKEIFLVNENYDVVILTGFANNVVGEDTLEWKLAHKNINEENKEYFDAVFESLQVNF